MNGSLRLRHLLWIGLAATVGLVVGFVVIAGTGNSDGGPEQRAGVEQSPADPVSEGTGGGGGAAPGQPVVPDLVGQRLPAAEALLNGAGFKHYDEKDVTSQNRAIVEKENWVVDSQSPAAGSATPIDTVIKVWVKKPTDEASPNETVAGVMPDVVCAELQAAQDVLRGSGFFLLTSKDGTGQNRLVLIDRNWVVIDQSEEPGSRPNFATVIVLTVVKHGEPTGLSGCAS